MIIPKTQLELDKQNLEQAIERTTLALASTASTLNNAYNALWNLPDERLLALLNSLGPQIVTDIFTAHNATAVSLNASLATAGSSVTAISTPAKELNLVSGQFVIIYPPEPEPIEEEPV